MAFSDPQSLTISGTAYAHARINGTGNDGTFRDAANSRDFVIRQSASKTRFRREIRFNVAKDYANPLTGRTEQISCSVGLFIDEPKSGFTDAELLALKSGLVTWLTDANVTKVLGGEN